MPFISELAAMRAESRAGRVMLLSCGPVASAVFSTGLVFLISWNFKPEILGSIAILELTAVFFTMALTFGCDQAYVREFASEKDKAALLANAFRVPTFATVAAVALLLVFLLIWEIEIIPQAGIAGTILAVGYAAGALIIRLLSTVLRMSERLLALAVLQATQRVVTLVLVTAVVVLTDVRQLMIVLSCYLLAVLVSVALHIFALRGELIEASRRQFHWEGAERLLRFGIPAGLAAILYALLASSDRLALAFWGSVRDLGIYMVAQSIAAILTIFTSIFAIIWAPFVYQSVAREKDESSYTPYVEAIVFASFACAGTISALAWFLPILFPADYDQLARYVPACMALPLFYLLAETYGVGLGVSRRMDVAFTISGGGAAVALALSFLLVPQFGVAGAALGILLGSLVFLIGRAELAARIWYRLPSQKMYFAVTLFTLGAALSLALGSVFQTWLMMYWVGFLIALFAMFRARLLLVSSLARQAYLQLSGPK
ncbi:hypothetical protein P7228_06510 [Altererythrobacter arenosus]|uniref:Oligosaccharide flippase family protein n=1 Tax=Altererythrobacter arenosus TaxID=3032592 RepID=A0ABY8FXC4_9SPHN|nr:oligosaccharide flippase family protein [Altererythrobacter sp. CAU 1644]WFL78710.1 hypothetical protein P7228_06510 [Altererythrobacter sp. CAU 1644]